MHMLWATSDSQPKETQTKAAYGEEAPEICIIM